MNELVPSGAVRLAAMKSLGLVLAGILMLGGVPAAAGAEPVPGDPGGMVFVNCWHQARGPTFSGYFVARARPHNCIIWGSPEDLANENALRDLRWLSWGRTTTTLTGQVRNTQPGMGARSGAMSRRGCRAFAAGAMAIGFTRE
jgi:hypothetical protein